MARRVQTEQADRYFMEDPRLASQAFHNMKDVDYLPNCVDYADDDDEAQLMNGIGEGDYYDEEDDE
jgi:hypothetical protein